MAGTMVRRRDDNVVPDTATAAAARPAERIDNPFRRPPTATWYGRKPARRLVALAILVLLAGNVWAFREVADRTDPITVADAVTAFRATQTATTIAARSGGTAPATAPVDGGATDAVAQPSPQLGGGAEQPAAVAVAAEPAPSAGEPGAVADSVPAPGVYVHDTTGSESVSVLGGSTHAYPQQSTVTVTRTACGHDLQWAPLQQRFDRYELCQQGRALEARAITTHHEFFGHSDEHRFTCTGLLLRLASDEPGATASGHCTSGDAGIDSTTTVVGVERLTVGGRAVDAVHTRADALLTGSSVGTKQLDFWFAVDTGLLVRHQAAVESDSSTVLGQTHYSERATLDLTDLAPRQ